MSNGKLPPYSGDRTTCLKCGHDVATTRYLSYGRCLHEAGVVAGTEANERLHRECCCCGFQWDERVAEASNGGQT
jgi:hypothetical protein